MHNYVRTAEALGHDVALYGPQLPVSPFRYSLDLRGAHAVVFIFEWTTKLQYGDLLDLMRLVSAVPRRRRIVIDCDGKYNDPIGVAGDSNHDGGVATPSWVDICDSLSDKIYQPTLHPLRQNVRPFFFHGYNQAWEVPLNFRHKAYGMMYVGNNWFRWRALRRMLEAIKPIRPRVGRVGLVGHGWATPAPWSGSSLGEDAYYSEPAYLRSLDVELLPPIPFDQVIGAMGQGIFSPVIYRPLFDHLQMVTCRTFETLAANTIPVFCQKPAHVTEVYGPAALDLVLPEEHPHEKILDILDRPAQYAEIVLEIRRHLTERHSYTARLQRLIQFIES